MTIALERTSELPVIRPVPDPATSRLFRRSPSHVRKGPGLQALQSMIEGPWDMSDLAALAGRSAVAVIGILVAWEGASRSVAWSTQEAWTALGVGCLVIGLTGVTSWIRSGVLRLRQTKLEVLETLRPVEASIARSTATPPWLTRGETGRLADDATIVLGPGMSCFHRPSCVFAVGKGLQGQRRAVARKAGAAPCGVCRP
jgi:hypothetical protein